MSVVGVTIKFSPNTECCTINAVLLRSHAQTEKLENNDIEKEQLLRKEHLGRRIMIGLVVTIKHFK